MEYRVVFEYDVDVAGPLEAAQCAYSMITDPASLRPVATVTGPDGTAEEIDLETEEC